MRAWRKMKTRRMSPTKDVFSWRLRPVVLVFPTLAAGEDELGFGPASFQIEQNIGAWRSLVARSVRDRKAGGSNPLAPTNIIVSL